jgi:acyl-CoA hydrolase
LLERDGQFLHGAFYLGSPAFYDWLRELDDDTRRGIDMRRVSEVNELYGGNETLERLQRRDARFFNSCMMATALGAAVSDQLDDGRVVSGVGGQYNFVAMAHALPEARSVLMLRAVRTARHGAQSSIVWNYGHATIPRHLRDLYISEYGIADVHSKADEDCIVAMAGIADARFQDALVDEAKRNRKLRRDFVAPQAWLRNTPASLDARLAPFQADGTLPDYPLGSDFTEVEQRVVKALGWLKANTIRTGAKLRVIAHAFVAGGTNDEEALTRMQLEHPHSAGEWLEARLLSLALRETGKSAT